MGLSRITQRSVSDSALRGLQASLARTATLQNQLSSGKRISNPSDDPSGTASAMTFRSQRSAAEQHLRNIDGATGRLNTTDSALTDLSDRLNKIRELMVRSQSGALSTEGRSALSAEVSAVRGNVVDIYNTRYLDRPVFGGTAAGDVALDATDTYVGNDATVEVRISRDATVRVDVKGTDVAADTVPALLTQIATEMTTGGVTAASFAALDAARSKVLRAIGDVGSRGSRVEAAKTQVDSLRLDLQGRISESEDIDLPETIMNLESQKVAYQAALGAASKVLQTSLVDFLK
ncbi:flagellar hook-associated protein FlgL [Kineosporia sp. R_H_3]|uniref:flagellar hook-associated protein FlgL n=1 Tax=Kineosporia sp. R_H_3 TaxID=1961848 RepID=UPI000B4B6726|nr:flagellar hook-associated protein FlgL [Kineosporia sp. R_H_3]